VVPGFASDGTELAAARGHEDAVNGVAWSPGGRRIATASDDRTARVWDAETGAELAVLHGHEDAVQGADWSPEGERIATASRDRTARVRDAGTNLDALVAKAHARVLRELTDEERRSALLPGWR
jgi:WD40 repeat protein